MVFGTHFRQSSGPRDAGFQPPLAPSPSPITSAPHRRKRRYGRIPKVTHEDPLLNHSIDMSHKQLSQTPFYMRF